MTTKINNSLPGAQKISSQEQSYTISTQNLRRIDDFLEIFLAVMALRLQNPNPALNGAIVGVACICIANSKPTLVKIEEIRDMKIRSICNSIIMGLGMYMGDGSLIPFLAGVCGVSALERRLYHFANGTN
jgi:hypothetical protein